MLSRTRNTALSAEQVEAIVGTAPPRRHLPLRPRHPHAAGPRPPRRAVRGPDPHPRAPRRQPPGPRPGRGRDGQDPPGHGLGPRAYGRGSGSCSPATTTRSPGDRGRAARTTTSVVIGAFLVSPSRWRDAAARGASRCRPRLVDHHRRGPHRHPLAPGRPRSSTPSWWTRPRTSAPPGWPCSTPSSTPRAPGGCSWWPTRPRSSTSRGFTPPSPDDGWTQCELVNNCRNAQGIARLLRRYLDGAPSPCSAPRPSTCAGPRPTTWRRPSPPPAPSSTAWSRRTGATRGIARAHLLDRGARPAWPRPSGLPRWEHRDSGGAVRERPPHQGPRVRHRASSCPTPPTWPRTSLYVGVRPGREPARRGRPPAPRRPPPPGRPARAAGMAGDHPAVVPTG